MKSSAEIAGAWLGGRRGFRVSLPPAEIVRVLNLAEFAQKVFQR